MYEISEKEFNHIDIAPSPQNDTNSLRVFRKYDICPFGYNLYDFDGRYFITEYTLATLQAILPVKKELSRIASRALEPDYVRTISAHNTVIESPAPRPNHVRDGDFRAALSNANREIEILEYTIPRIICQNG